MKRIELALPVAAMWLLMVAVLLIQSLPWIPSTLTQWLVVVGIGPPLYLAGEGIFSWLLSLEHGYRLSPRPFSVLRVLAALATVIMSCGIIWFVLSWLEALP